MVRMYMMFWKSCYINLSTAQRLDLDSTLTIYLFIHANYLMYAVNTLPSSSAQRTYNL